MAERQREPWEEVPVVRSARGRSAEEFLHSPGVEKLLSDVEALRDGERDETSGWDKEWDRDGQRVEGSLDYASCHPNEVRVTSETGGQKGAKNTEFLRLPSSIAEVARHFHDGSEKYKDPVPGVANWSLGYAWSLSLNALHRHLDAWERGDSVDPEFDRTHLAAVAFHALVLMEFEAKGIGTDDRYTDAARERYLAEQAEAF